MRLWEDVFGTPFKRIRSRHDVSDPLRRHADAQNRSKRIVARWPGILEQLRDRRMTRCGADTSGRIGTAHEKGVSKCVVTGWPGSPPHPRCSPFGWGPASVFGNSRLSYKQGKSALHSP